MAGDVKYDFIVHYNDDEGFMTCNIDSDRYSYMYLVEDMCKGLYGEKRDEVDFISITCEIPNSDGSMKLANDEDVMNMFKMYALEGETQIHIYLEMNNVNCHGEVVSQGVKVGGNDNYYEISDDEDWYVGEEGECSSEDDENVSVDLEGDVDDVNDVGAELSDYNGDDCDKYLEGSDIEVNYVDRGIRGRQYIPNESEKVKLEKGMLFKDVTDFRAVLKDYIIQEGFEIVRVKNEKSRVTAHCAASGCTWYIHASPTPDGVTYQIKVYRSEHSCIRSSSHSDATSTWIAEKLEASLKADPNLSYDKMSQELMAKYGIEVSTSRLYRAKKFAKEKLEGNHTELYSKFPKYVELVKQTNPGSLVKLQLHRPSINHNPSFKRFFLCLEAMRKGFTEGCRPFIGVDGCHLKGRYGGVLLVAVSLDANNSIFPVAVAIVESEGKDSWGWFLNYLDIMIGQRTNGIKMIIMSDRQKGLPEAVLDVMPEATHRHCAMHIFNNLKGKFPGLILEDAFWAASQAYNTFLWDKAMKRIERASPEAHAWLCKIPKEQWARHTFDPMSKSDHVTNNMTESFNSWILKSKDKPVLTLIEQLRIQCMQMFHRRYQNGCSCESKVMPKIKAKLDIINQDSRCCKIMPASGDEYEVLDGFTHFVVNLRERSCMCGFWAISGLPCKHAAICITYKRGDIQDYCDPFYLKDTYLKAYSEIIHPIPDMSMLPSEDVAPHDIVWPPYLKRLPGRPRKSRRRTQHEGPVGNQESRRSNTVKCDICKAFGHNRRTCQKAPVAAKARGKTKGATVSQSQKGSTSCTPTSIQRPAGSSTPTPIQRPAGSSTPTPINAGSSTQSAFVAVGGRQGPFVAVGGDMGPSTQTSTNTRIKHAGHKSRKRAKITTPLRRSARLAGW